MARYDGLIIPRSYSEYINKTDSATLQQALQQSGVLDSAPTEDSVKAVKSGGVFDALAGKQPTLTFDNVPTEDSDNPVKSGGIYDALETKQDVLTFDDMPTADSDNPVKSSGLVNSVPVDEVTKNNMHSATSNSVAQSFLDLCTYVDGWYILKLTGNKYLGAVIRVGSRSSSSGGYLMVSPSGYTTVEPLSAAAYQTGNTGNVLQTFHKSDNNTFIYLSAGTGAAYTIRVIAILQKTT